jgi:hypothetical protein
MAVSAITSIKNAIGFKGSTKKESVTRIPKDDSLDIVPTVGFRVGYKMGTTKLQVLVLGARHLPAKVGMTPLIGYTIKVKLFPGKDKFETGSKPESWPVYNQNFNFEIANIPVGKTGKPLSEVLRASNFLVFTIYAEDFKKKKRALGAVTWPLDHTLFTHKANSLDYGSKEEFETPEIWKKTAEISSGIAGVKQKIEERSSQLEVMLCYYPGNPEEGETDSLTIGVTKLRWSIEATRECEQRKALLYVKMEFLEGGSRSINASKSTRHVPPNISVHFLPDKDNSTLSVQLPSNKEDLTCRFSVCTKPTFGKKIVVGRVVVGPGSEQWDKAFETPILTRTQWHSIR